MRRTILLLATVALVLTVALPAAALPKKAFSFDTVCDLDGDRSLVVEVHFVTVGNHLAGWAVPWSPVDGLSGGVLVGGTQSYTQDGQPVGEPFTWGPPPGLESRVTLCQIEGPIEPSVYKVLVDPAWIFFPPGPPA